MSAKSNRNKLSPDRNAARWITVAQLLQGRFADALANRAH